MQKEGKVLLLHRFRRKVSDMVGVVQLVRASDCGSECRGFESHLPPSKISTSFLVDILYFCVHKNGRKELIRDWKIKRTLE